MAKPAPISRWEWIAAAFSTILVLATMVTLLVKGRQEQTPPRLSIRIERIEPSGVYFRVAFVIRNDGRRDGSRRHRARRVATARLRRARTE